MELNHFALDSPISGINSIEVELSDNVPLVFGPLRSRVRYDLSCVVLKRKPFDLIRREGPRIEADVLVARILRRMLIGITPAQLHGSVCMNSRPVEVVLQHTCGDLHSVDVNLDARGAA